MRKRLAVSMCLSACTIMATSAILASAAEAQRGGGGRGGGGASRGGGGSYSARPSRPSNGPSMRGGSRSSINQNVSGGNRNRVNRGNINRGNNNVNRGNINTGDINIDRNINIDNDWDGGWYGAVIARVMAQPWWPERRSARRCRLLLPLAPANCATIYRASLSYYQCGAVWYQPVYSGSTVQYVVVEAP